MQINTAALHWLAKQPELLQGIGRGVERETLRINQQGEIAKTLHPNVLGKALTHDWITTDFAEALLEFITPVERSIEDVLLFLTDLHSYTTQQSSDEMFWPFSMPCFVEEADDILIAQYGHSNIGRLKTLYRQGLKRRYGTLMQLISGVHYNFSFSQSFWQAYWQADWQKILLDEKADISAGYLRVIRNYYRFGWLIPYFFGASPAICASFLQGKKSHLPLKMLSPGVYTLENATSLRLSDLGYTNQGQQQLPIQYNQLSAYISVLRQATQTSSSRFESIGLLKGGEYQQINSNILQIENELYAPIRPKRVTLPGERPSQALNRGGIEYIEVRSLDIDPFSPIGVSEQQLAFLDIFLVWCLLTDSPFMEKEEQQQTRENWNQVIYAGRDLANLPCLPLKERSLRDVALGFFDDFQQIAAIFDQQKGKCHYQTICGQLKNKLLDPQQTQSARLSVLLEQQSFSQLGLTLARQYHDYFLKQPLQRLTMAELQQARSASVAKQQQLEKESVQSFDVYLRQVNA